MEKLYFEDVHRAASGYPYIDPDSVNLSYVVHFHDEIELVCVRSGETTVITENGSFPAGKDTVCLFMPGELHGFVSQGENKLFVLKAQVPAAPEEEKNVNLSKIRLHKNIFAPQDTAHQKLLFLSMRSKENTACVRLDLNMPSGHG